MGGLCALLGMRSDRVLGCARWPVGVWTDRAINPHCYVHGPRTAECSRRTCGEARDTDLREFASTRGAWVVLSLAAPAQRCARRQSP